MKKIISILFASLLFSVSAHAGGMIGIKYGTGELEGTKHAYTAGSNDYSAETKDVSNEYGAIFAELDLGDSPVALGVEFIPYTATISVDGNSSDSHLELSDHTTLYAQLSHDIDNGGSLYVKAGLATADIGNVTANYETTSINTKDSSLEGVMIGVGVQSAELGPFGMVARIETTWIDYDDVSVTTTSNGSATVKKTADAELTTFSISLAKTF
tara:strand:- start:1957 stop:2595 length:639 start_codon:yes stop_codon:yes gene_type:complete